MNKKKWLGVLLLVSLYTILMIGSNTQLVSAAKKPSLTKTEFTITVGKYRWYSLEKCIDNMVSDAKYSYETSNKKIVTVDKNGYIIGVKAGKAKITVYQTYKKKKTKVGTVNVTVKKSAINEFYKEEGVEINYKTEESLKAFDEYNSYNLNNWNDIDPALLWPRSDEAKYTFESSNPKKVKIDKDGNIIYISKPGVSVTVTVKETYNKKTIKIGSFKLKIRTPKVTEKEIQLSVNHSIYPANYLYGMNTYYLITDSEKDVNKIDFNEVGDAEKTTDSDSALIWDVFDGEWQGSLTGSTEGVAYLHFFYGNKPSKDTYVGTIKVNVVYKATKNIEWYDDAGEELVVFECYDSDFNADYTSGRLWFYIDPHDGSDLPEVTIEDESVATAKLVENGENYVLYLYAKKEGTTKVTLTLGNKSISKNVKFKKVE